MTAEQVGLASIVRLHPLVVQYRDGWIVGRPDAASLLEIGCEGITYIRELQGHGQVSTAQQRVDALHGPGIDCLGFTQALIDADLVASVDGHPLGIGPRAESLPWLRPDHVQWVFRAPALTFVALVMVSGLVAGAREGLLLPSYEAYFLSNWQGLNVSVNAAMFVVTIGLHELSHLMAARAAGVHARISLGSRLHFLVAQTTVTGLWVMPRRIRLRVYLSGMVTDVLVACVAMLILAGGASGLGARCLEALILGQLLSFATQFGLYMRTDVYLILQEALRCKNLYHDAASYLKFLWRTVTGKDGTDPTSTLPGHERVPVRIYSIVMGLGTVVSLTLFATYGAPVLITTLTRAAGQISAGIDNSAPLAILDGLAVIVVLSTIYVIFGRVIVTKHRSHITRLLRRFRRPRLRGGAEDEREAGLTDPPGDRPASRARRHTDVAREHLATRGDWDVGKYPGDPPDAFARSVEADHHHIEATLAHCPPGNLVQEPVAGAVIARVVKIEQVHAD